MDFKTASSVGRTINSNESSVSECLWVRDTPNFIHHDPDFPNFQTREDYKQWFIGSRNAFLDLHLTIEDMIAEGDQVAVRWTFRGTNTGDMVTPMPIPANGKQVTITGITISRFAEGKFVED